MPVVVSPKPDASGGSEARSAVATHPVTGIVTETRFFRLRRPIEVTEYEEDGVWIHEYKPLNILAYAKSRKESWQIFVRQFDATWEWIVQEDDARLAGDAQELKRRFFEAVEAVETVL